MVKSNYFEIYDEIKNYFDTNAISVLDKNNYYKIKEFVNLLKKIEKNNS